MSEITQSHEYNELISSIQALETELAELVLKRDELLYHVCPRLQTEYMLKVGKLEYAVYEMQIKILRTKREIEIIQSFLNREQPYVLADVEKQLNLEYEEYTKNLLDKQKEIDEARFKNANRGKLLSDEEGVELKKLYTQIVKKIHPDINPNTTEQEHSQFSDAVEAYKNGSLSELRIIYLLLGKTIPTAMNTQNTMEKLTAKREMLIEEKCYLCDKINKIKNTFPYNTKDLLLDEKKMQSKIDDLSNLLTEYNDQYKGIKNYLSEMLNNP